MDDGPEQARYTAMRWNTPLSIAHADLLLKRLAVGPDDVALDLGCGWGELLLRLLAATPGARGVGVDSDAALLTRGRDAARAAGLVERVEFLEGDAANWTQPADHILCLGAAHAWTGPEQQLSALAALLRPGGRVLLGEGCWEHPPTAEAAELFPEVLPLVTLVDTAHAGGWQVVHLTTADQREWDNFETTWRAGRHAWLIEHPDHPSAPDVRDTLRRQVHEYVDLYRGRLGFAYLILTRG